MSSEELRNRLSSIIHETPFSDGVTYEYPGNLFKVFEWYRPRKVVKQPKKFKGKRVRTDQSNSDEAVQRAKGEIRNYILANDFDIWVTCTFATDRQNADLCLHKMHSWLKNWQKRHPKCKYLCVHEYHADDASLHFHILLEGFTGKIIPAVNPKTGKPVRQHGRQVYSIASFQHGFSSVVKIDGTVESRRKLASYLGKYMSKDMPEFFNKKRYWHFKNLNHPSKTPGLPVWYGKVEPLWTKELEFGRQSWFLLDGTEVRKG